ncbi:MAG TPA: endolytic transglycosylase MltG [Methylomirabilota bacterium]|nr:endolytic transglycosylase MltG [Methylomirabilota bacterium]
MACLGGAALVALGVALALRPPPPLQAGPRTLEIPTTLGALGIARHLAEQGVIRSQVVFLGATVLRGTVRSLKAGEYEVPQGAPLLAVLQLLETGRVKPHLLVLPEGFTIRELARQIDAEGIAPAADVIRVAGSPRMAWSLGIEADSLEGYLFPDSYQVTKGMRVEEILGRMVQRFRDRVGTADVIARAQQRDLSLHQVVTLASIVEKETALAAERPIIARVFLNRLQRDMPLQADPTVSYALAKEGRSPTRDDLQIDHPFNTYRNRGLPPGPIGSPGRPAIDAVLEPANVPYLYFVAIDDRAHHFSTTLEEHNQAVARYRQYRARPRAAATLAPANGPML